MAGLPLDKSLQGPAREKLSSSAEPALAKAEGGEDSQKVTKGSGDEEKPKDIAKASDTKDGAAVKDTSRIGFKHDPKEEEVLAGVELDVRVPKKRKNPRRSKAQRGVKAPTGFEPFFADAPMTPKEFEDNKRVYDPRLSEAIMRFLYKRLLSPYRRKVFLKFLQYGRITVGPRHSQGVTPSELKDMTKDEAMEARSMTAIFPENLKGCTVAFNHVTAGYLSAYFMGHYNPDTEEEIRECTDTIKNYFSYLLYHNVCPEYKDDLEEGRKTCDLAAKELWMNQQLVHHDGPGSFNRGCSMLFGGHYFESVGDSDTWKAVRHVADEEIFTIEIARKVVKYAIAIAGNDRTAQKFKILADKDGITAKEIEDIDGFEVISIEQPTIETIAFYSELSPDLVPVGRVIAKEFRDPARGPIDLTPWEKVDWDAGFAPTYQFEFLVEAPLLVHLLPGMKIVTTVFETNVGQHFFDEILAALPTFYTFLYNDWLMDYKEPMPVDFIPDEEEISRRRAQASILRPIEPTPAEWTLHMLVREINFGKSPGESDMEVGRQFFKCLEDVGWDLQEVKELVGLEEPQKGKEGSTKEEKGKKTVHDEQGVEQLAGETKTVSLDFFIEQDPDKPLSMPELIKAFRKKNLELLVKKGLPPPSQKFAEGTEKEQLDRLIKSFHNPEKIKVTISPEFKESFRRHQLKMELKELEPLKQQFKDLELREQKIKEQLGLGSSSQGAEIPGAQGVPKDQEREE
ncbi:hypothetical protein N7457_004694 [Penicillium paradoxum]|uniref:uncharacterized protein n=1 Tax=Penicillium paradoxum TaxID=176176 RepID=UPI002547DE5E|nr:uncharacterized protein N7457_004694 [Penicillium paradoxum]KAJ5782920.1 hypothetical protein N7457_004694 [Penicillium paradoxum]